MHTRLPRLNNTPAIPRGTSYPRRIATAPSPRYRPPMPARPHIVIFNPDQWRADAIGHLGNPAAVTPHLDAACDPDTGDFVSFRNAFCQNPVCTPSRCSFMSGWYPHVRGHRTMQHMLHIDRGEHMLLKELKDGGYHVWWGGKNDLVPGQHGYDAFADERHNAREALRRHGRTHGENLHATTHWRGEPPPAGDNYYSFYRGLLKPDGSAKPYGDNDWGQVLGACDKIRQHTGDQPLCVYLPITYPHPPYGVEEPYFSAIDRSKLPPRTPAPGTTASQWEASGKPMILGGIYEMQGMQGWTEDRWDELRAVYYGMCMRVDQQFGMVMQALRDANRYDDAAVFFFSDHGDFTGDFGLVEKTQNTFEDPLTNVPLLIKPPKGTPCQPRVCDALVELIDFTATAYDLAGIDPGYDHFGRSLMPVLAGETDEHRDAVFCEGGRRRGETQAMDGAVSSAPTPQGLYYPRVFHQTADARPYHGKAAMCRTHTHKYVRRLYEMDELYDLHHDPHEQHNRLHDPALAEIKMQLEHRMLDWYQQTCDVVPREVDARG